MSLHMLRAALAAAVTALALLAATGGWIAAPAQAGITATGSTDAPVPHRPRHRRRGAGPARHHRRMDLLPAQAGIIATGAD